MRHLHNYKIYENRYSIQSGINNLVRKYTKMGCEVELSPRYYDSVYLNIIKVPENLKGKGIATDFMQDLIDWSNKMGLVITLSPTNKMGSDMSRLTDFYKRFGFIKNRLNHRDSQYIGNMIKFPDSKIN